MGSLLFYVLNALVIAVVVVIIITNVKFRTANDVSLPPGPPAEPLIGHARLIPRIDQAEFCHEMRKSYGNCSLLSAPIPYLMTVDLHVGDVIYFNALRKSIVVLNSVEVAVDLLDKRSSIYGDRPYFGTLVDV
jgi:hypothetical protein